MAGRGCTKHYEPQAPFRLRPTPPQVPPTPSRASLWLLPVADAEAGFSSWSCRGGFVSSDCGCCYCRSYWASARVGSQERRTNGGCLLLEFVDAFAFFFSCQRVSYPPPRLPASSLAKFILLLNISIFIDVLIQSALFPPFLMLSEPSSRRKKWLYRNVWFQETADE